MKLLITYPLDNKVLTTILADNITYRPDIEIKGKRFLPPTLAQYRPDILITRTLPNEAILHDWHEAMALPPAIILVGQPSATLPKTIGGIRIYRPEANPDVHPDLWSLQLAERINTCKLAIPAILTNRPKNKQVILVGAGIITGSHNTGGFAQALAVAMAVLASLQGKHHPMQTLYHPARYSAFTKTTEQPLLCV